LNRLESIS